VTAIENSSDFDVTEELRFGRICNDGFQNILTGLHRPTYK
jgi:hypothetical protein